MALFTDDVVTRFRADTRDYDQALAKARDRLDDVGGGLTSASRASDGMFRSGEQLVRSLRGVGRELGDMGRSSGSLSQKVSGLAFETVQLGQALTFMGGRGQALGATVTKVGLLATATGLFADDLKAGALAAWDLAHGIGFAEANARDLKLAMADISRKAGEDLNAEEERRRRQAVDRELEAKFRLEGLEFARQQQEYQRKAAAAEQRRLETNRARLEVEREAEERNMAALMQAAEFEEGVRRRRKALIAPEFGPDPDDLMEWTDTLNVFVAEIRSRVEEMQEAFPGGALAAILFPPSQAAAFELDENPLLSQILSLQDVSIAAATTIGAAFAGMSLAVGAAFDRAIGASVRFVHADKEAEKATKALALTTGQAMQVIVRDVLKGVATEAAVRAVFELAMAAAALATWNLPAAGKHLAAAKLFAITAGMAGAAAFAVPSVTKTIPAAPSTEPPVTRGDGREFGRERGGGPVTYTYNVLVPFGVGSESVVEEMRRTDRQQRRERGRGLLD